MKEFDSKNSIKYTKIIFGVILISVGISIFYLWANRINEYSYIKNKSIFIDYGFDTYIIFIVKIPFLTLFICSIIGVLLYFIHTKHSIFFKTINKISWILIFIGFSLIIFDFIHLNNILRDKLSYKSKHQYLVLDSFFEHNPNMCIPLRFPTYYLVIKSEEDNALTNQFENYTKIIDKNIKVRIREYINNESEQNEYFWNMIMKEITTIDSNIYIVKSINLPSNIRRDTKIGLDLNCGSNDCCNFIRKSSLISMYYYYKDQLSFEKIDSKIKNEIRLRDCDSISVSTSPFKNMEKYMLVINTNNPDYLHANLKCIYDNNIKKLVYSKLPHNCYIVDTLGSDINGIIKFDEEFTVENSGFQSILYNDSDTKMKNFGVVMNTYSKVKISVLGKDGKSELNTNWNGLHLNSSRIVKRAYEETYRIIGKTHAKGNYSMQLQELGFVN